MLSNKIEACLWLTRLFTIFATVNYFFGLLSDSPHLLSYYQKVLLSNAITSALRLHQRVPNFQFTREYFGQLFLEDSAHYLIYSILFITSGTISMAILPLFLYALLHAQAYTKQLLNLIGPSSLSLVRNLLSKLEQNQVNILRFIACSEIFLMPAIILTFFTGQGSLFLPFLYYRFLSLRYSSRRNPYCKQLFCELRMSAESLCSGETCPQFIRSIVHKIISIICRLAPY
ncbi:hypothetical protein HELRODRAFT_76712 [Helobdella robusta]|uniref:Transmembrane protein 33 n=1 Tax=Helobdella robusta TaxID=6412 RepID=T1G2N1_HELRO|nr:hypothetical protein HELRODRAFT_76712 [Helobdella robusta]ESO07431.1 hypothetical protein HELRODRAFT_76712 [Helobdella robusta]